MMEKDFYTAVTKLLIDHDLTGGFEVKLVRGGTYNPSIVEKAQMFILMSSGLASHKIADVGIHQKFLDIVIIKDKYLVLVWEKYDYDIVVITPSIDIFTKKHNYKQLKKQSII